MTLDEILKILGKEEATRVAQCGKNASWHWYQKGAKRKVPNISILVAWADHLELTDADLGELIRDSNRIRTAIFELLAQDDKVRLKKRSVLRRSLAREIAEEVENLRKTEQLEKEIRAQQKEIALQQEAEAQKLEDERLKRLEQIRNKLKKLRRD
jgi:predicted RNA-binding protein with PIN domain